MQDISVGNDDLIMQDLMLLAQGPNVVGSQYQRSLVNGYRFHTKKLEKNKGNSKQWGFINTTTSSFSSIKDKNPVCGELACYGVLKDIIELN